MPLHRQVFFIGGFDPKSPRHYHRLYRDAAAHRPATPGQTQATVDVGPRERTGAWTEAWDVRWNEGQAPARWTRYTVLRWDDIVRQHWSRGWAQSIRDHIRVYLRGGRQGVFGRVRRQAPAGFWLALLPLAVSAGAWLAAALGTALAVWAGVSAWLAALVGLPAGWLLWRSLEDRLDSGWLLRLYAFTVAQADPQLPALEQRLDAWAAALVDSVRQQPCKEVLVVGHSTGSMLAVLLVDRAQRLAPGLGQGGPALALLTLGHCTPILAGLDQARDFRAALARVADQPALGWLDVSAPADWAAFARVGPWLSAGRARCRQVSPRFHRTMTATGYAALLADRQALHLHYLRPQEQGGGYDVVALTAAPALMAERLQADSPWSV